MKAVSLWEILVPCTYNTGKPVKTRHHKEWDKVVERIAGGLTIHTPTKGKWKDKKSDISYHERMIPVRVACTQNQIKQIADFSARHYKQKAIMVFKVSDQVTIYEYHEEG